jgi:hypothetical protein
MLKVGALVIWFVASLLLPMSLIFKASRLPIRLLGAGIAGTISTRISTIITGGAKQTKQTIISTF